MNGRILKTFFNLIVLLVCFGNIPLFAQLNSANLTRYSEEDGLPGAQVNRIVTDRFGYIWIGTMNGLTRFDGNAFKRFYFNPNDTLTLHGQDVQSMYQDDKGQLWVGAAASNLNVYNPATATFKHYSFAHLVDHPANVQLEIRTICGDDNGRIYFGVGSYRNETFKSALLYKDAGSDSLKVFLAPDSLRIENGFSIIKDKQGNVFFLNFNGIYKIDSKGKLISNALGRISSVATALFKKNDEYAIDFKSDKEGNLWFIGSRSRLYRFGVKDSSFQVISPPGTPYEQNNYNQIIFDKANNLWLGTNKGVIRYDPGSGKFELFNERSKTGIKPTDVSSLEFDSFGTLWIGTSNGIFKYEQRLLFASYGYGQESKNALTAGWANTLTGTADGNIWIATSGTNVISGGLAELDPGLKAIRAFPLKSILPGSFIINSAFEDSPGELLLNSNEGNWEFSTRTGQTKKIELKGVPANSAISQFYKDSKGNFWLCTLSGLYKRNNQSGIFTRYDLSLQPGANSVSNEVTKAVESPKHGLWLTTNNGLFLYDYRTDKIKRHGFDKEQGDIFLTQDVNSLYEDGDGLAWVGTWQGGLSMYNPESGKIKTFTMNDGLPSMCIQAILPDQKNNTLWLSTFDGLSRMDLKTNEFNNFSIADGIQSQLFADGSCFRTSAGLFIFGGSNGITVFNPDDINKRSTPPVVFLTDLKLFNKSVVPGTGRILKSPIYDTKEITLNYNENNISLEFLAIHYSNSSKNKYAFKLDNYDNEWREIGNQHVAYYPNLPPGKYIFHLKAANSHGVWNETGATLGITVNPPWWKTFGAYILYGLILVALAFALNHYFRRRLIQKEREKTQERELAQAKEIEKAYTELKTTQAQLIQSEKMASLGELTAGIAHEIQNPLNFINNFSEVNRELIVEMKQAIATENFQEVTSLAEDIDENEEKINHHGKRADGIVKGMLQHSRANTGQKIPTDVNALAEEYLKLAYHGIRGKDNSFNVTIRTDFDPRIGQVNLIPQDIGRVLLNLYNNAFYAVNDKKSQGDVTYEPTVTLHTEKSAGKIFIICGDNGNGIPQNIADKIFQPFFTTKPAGKGTGLGLSLSYDIIKAHGGDIKMETEVGAGTKFIIQLPIA